MLIRLAQEKGQQEGNFAVTDYFMHEYIHAFIAAVMTATLVTLTVMVATAQRGSRFHNRHQQAAIMGLRFVLEGYKSFITDKVNSL